MALKNTETSWGWLAKTFHWLMAFLIITLLIVGNYMHSMPDSMEKIELYQMHKSFGLVALMLLVLRLLWRFVNPTPKLPADMHILLKLGAHGSHFALYALMFAMVMSGWVMSTSSPFAAAYPLKFFGLFEWWDFTGVNEPLNKQAHRVHFFASYGLIAIILLHFFASIKHHFWNKDDILLRMLPGKYARSNAKNKDETTV